MKYAVITGGSKGIGQSLVKRFSENGYKVLSLDIEEPSFKLPGVNYKTVDIKDENAIREIAKSSLHVDVLINNAAVQYVNPLKDLEDKQIRAMLDTNIYGTLNVTRAFIPFLNEGLIVNVGSVHSETPRTEKIPYDMSKAALSIFTKEIALELSEQNTRAICVEFGAVKTPMNDNFNDKDSLEKALSKQVINHLMTSEECAELIYELTTEKYQYMNGQTVKYDCGRSLKN